MCPLVQHMFLIKTNQNYKGTSPALGHVGPAGLLCLPMPARTVRRIFQEHKSWWLKWVRIYNLDSLFCAKASLRKRMPAGGGCPVI